MAGHSVDNLAPAAPQGVVLHTLPNGQIRLTWQKNRTESDVAHYVVYRSTKKGFEVGESTRLLTTTDSTAVDSSAQAGRTYFYRVTTVDIHGNESQPSKELALTDVPQSEPKLPVEFALRQNYPNPFNPTTVISYQLPVASDVTLFVFDILGREVARLVDTFEEPGYKSIEWEASGVASGVYLYRLRAGNFVQTRKLLVMK